MNLSLSSVSPQIRALALFGVAAVLGLVVVVVGLSRKPATSGTSAQPVQHVGRVHRAHRTKPAPARPARPHRHVHARRPLAAVVQAAVAQGLPLPLAKQFHRHEAVVVELYSSDAPVDKLALAEAKTGAKAAKAGFLPVNVIARKDAVARALAAKLGVLHAPVLLVFKRPGVVAVRINGFSDDKTVAQAAVNAAAPA